MKQIIAYAIVTAFITAILVSLAVTTNQMQEYRAAAEDAVQTTQKCLDLVHLQEEVMAEYRQQRDMYQSTLNDFVGPAEINLWVERHLADQASAVVPAARRK